MSEPLLEGKSHDIPKRLVWDAWLKVKGNGGAAGADGVTIEQFGATERLKDNLFKLWNRISSGSYFPGPVRAVEIPKKGGTRVLGIPNVVDRVHGGGSAEDPIVDGAGKLQTLLAQWVDQIGPVPLVIGLAILVGAGILLARRRIRRRSRMSSEDTLA